MGRVSSQHERVTVTVHGKPSAVLIATEDLDRWRRRSSPGRPRHAGPARRVRGRADPGRGGVRGAARRGDGDTATAGRERLTSALRTDHHPTARRQLGSICPTRLRSLRMSSCGAAAGQPAASRQTPRAAVGSAQRPQGYLPRHLPHRRAEADRDSPRRRPPSRRLPQRLPRLSTVRLCSISVDLR